jgi:hypothetical protein
MVQVPHCLSVKILFSVLPLIASIKDRVQALTDAKPRCNFSRLTPLGSGITYALDDFAGAAAFRTGLAVNPPSTLAGTADILSCLWCSR